MDTDNALRWFNTACNVLEFFIIVWLVRDRRILVISLKQLSITVCELARRTSVDVQPKTQSSPDK